jgi:hypothetical protein
MIQTVMIALLALTGCAFIIVALVAGVRKVAYRWQTVEGAIQNVEITPVAGESTCVVTVEYGYSVGDVHYACREIVQEIPDCVAKRDHDTILRYYQQGKPLKVYVPSRNPQAAQLQCVEDESLFVTFVMMGAGLLALISATLWSRALPL